MLCKLHFNKVINIGRNSFILKSCFHLNKTFFRYKQTVF